MTTLYFESSDEDDLRRTGFSKDGKHQCPQIFLGLLVASGGNPISYEIFEGNIFEGKTFIPVLQNVEKKYGLGKPIVIADSGLLSKKNIELLEKGGYQYTRTSYVVQVFWALVPKMNQKPSNNKFYPLV